MERKKSFVIPRHLELITSRDRGEEGRAWLAQLPCLVAEFEERWSIEVGVAFLPGGATGFVAPATRSDGSAAVLKLTLPDRDTRHECSALKAYGGVCSVHLLEADPLRGALLLERCDPGTPLWSMTDEEAANSTSAVILRQLWVVVPENHPFELLSERAREWRDSVASEFGRLGRPFEKRLADEATLLFRELSTGTEEQVLLHQDFHHGNVLAAQRQPWLAIDPKPLVGDRAFDAGGLLRDRRHALLNATDPSKRMARRLDHLSQELGLDRKRMRGWALAQAVELGLWSLNAGFRENGHGLIECARLLAGLPD